MPRISLSDVVVITGATAGVGRATAIEFAKKGASIGLIARDKKRLEDTQKELRLFGVKIAYASCDVANAQELEHAAKSIEEELGEITIWINNATTTVFSPVTRITPDEYKRVTEVTYLGTVYGTMSALKRMLKRNSGTIIQVGSALSYRAIPLQSAYSGAKHAIRAFTDSLRVELMHDKKQIHLTMVQLPALNTPQFSWSRTHINKHPQPVPPIFQPEVAARAIVWASEHKRREVWVGKPSVATIIMNKLFPALIDKYLALTGYTSQFVNKPLEKNIPGNLFKPVKGSFGAHGIFDYKAKNKSIQFEFEKIPFLHFFTDLFFAVSTTLTMASSFLKTFLKKKSFYLK